MVVYRPVVSFTGNALHQVLLNILVLVLDDLTESSSGAEPAVSNKKGGIGCIDSPLTVIRRVARVRNVVGRGLYKRLRVEKGALRCLERKGQAGHGQTSLLKVRPVMEARFLAMLSCPGPYAGLRKMESRSCQ